MIGERTLEEKEEVNKRFEQLETQLEVQKLWILASAGSRSLLT